MKSLGSSSANELGRESKAKEAVGLNLRVFLLVLQLQNMNVSISGLVAEIRSKHANNLEMNDLDV